MKILNFLILIFSVNVHAIDGSSTVTLEWDPHPDSNIIGYHLYYWPSSGSRVSATKVDLGIPSDNRATVSNLPGGQRYNFIVTASNPYGESDDSNIAESSVYDLFKQIDASQMSFVRDMSDPQKSLISSEFVMKGTVGAKLRVQVSEDLLNWSDLIPSPTEDAWVIPEAGSIRIVDTGAAGKLRRFYRVVEYFEETTTPVAATPASNTSQNLTQSSRPVEQTQESVLPTSTH